MKIFKVIISCGLLVLILACSHTATMKAQKPCTDDNWYKYVRLEVLKVFSAKDGNAIYKSYLVKWNDQEVVVNDSLSRTNFKVGDIITVVAMSHSFPNRKENYGLLSFEITPPEVVERLKKKNSEPSSVGDSQGRGSTGN